MGRPMADRPDYIDAEFEVVHDPRPHQALAVDVQTAPQRAPEEPVKLTLVDHISGWVALAVVLPTFFVLTPYLRRLVAVIDAQLFGP